MTDTERAMLAAVVADPGDDTVRLAFADCIEEHGNAARAAFIRLQVVAERLHPHSNARAKLEAQAEALFAEHWIDWWGELCAAVGLPMPSEPPAGFLGWIARWFDSSRPAAAPYRREGLTVYATHAYDSGHTREFSRVSFRRGFPEAVWITLAPPPALEGWSAVSPLTELDCESVYWAGWDDGPHLGSLRSLHLYNYDPTVLFSILESPHTGQLEEFRLTIAEEDYSSNEFITPEIIRALSLPRVRNLKRLAIPLWSYSLAEAVGSAPTLAGLESLEIDCYTDSQHDGLQAGDWIAALARSPFLAGLQELTVRGFNASVIALRNGAWTGLKKLHLDAVFTDENLGALAGLEGFPALDELWISRMRLDDTAGILLRSPLMKRIRHFSLAGRFQNAAHIATLADAVNLERIETFALNLPGIPPEIVDLLRAKLGDRLRLMS